MQEARAISQIRNIKKQWVANAIVVLMLTSAAITTIAITVLNRFLQVDLFWSIPLFGLITACIFLLNNMWKMTVPDVARILNKSLPELEESAGLILLPVQSLNLLERLQVQKIGVQLEALQPPNPLKRKLKQAAILFVISVVGSLLLAAIPFRSIKLHETNTTSKVSINNVPENVLPQIRETKVLIIPPSYTGKSARQQKRFNVEVEENGTIKWEINTNIQVKEVALRFNNNVILKYREHDKEPNTWTTQKVIIASGFYQVKVNDTWSEFYKIEVIKDNAPTISVRSPKQRSIIEFGQPQQAVINVALADDYGLSKAHILATVASGSGEAVKFKEQQLPITGFTSGRLQLQLQQRVDLRSLGMQPGDELYFFITAIDNKGQQARSDIYVVAIEDTANLMSMEGLATAMNIKPEFFRSQRQIIIETEQLLKSKDTMSVQLFNTKSNELGIDQKLLRLRYGKFLGEESHSEISEEHDDHDDDHNEASDFGNAEKIMDEYAHKHDIAEDATFFDPETKKQLKATLAEMWNAEGKLRTYKPAEALPFEYKALRLLKDLQQKSRVYVAKTSSKLPSIKTEKRLTGDLSKIGQPAIQKDIEPFEDGNLILRRALGALEQLKVERVAGEGVMLLFQQANRQLLNRAAANPAAYLASVQGLKRILENKYRKQDVVVVQKALQSMLGYPASRPTKRSTPSSSSLSDTYFNNLKSNL